MSGISEARREEAGRSGGRRSSDPDVGLRFEVGGGGRADVMVASIDIVLALLGRLIRKSGAA